MKRTVLRTVISVVLALFLAISLFVCGFCVYGYEVVCNPGVFMETAEASGYAQELYGEIFDKWENLLVITGVSDTESILEVLTPEQVKKDAHLYLENAYAGNVETPDTESLENSLSEKVHAYAYRGEDPDPIPELEANIQELVSACMGEYRQSVQIRLLPKLLSALGSRRSLMKIGIFASAGIALFFCVFLFFLQKKKKEFLYYGAMATATGALILLGGCWFARYQQILNRLPFEDSAMKTLVVKFLETLLVYLRQLGDLYLAVTVLLLVLYLLFSLLAKRKKT